MAQLERIYKVPLRREFLKVPRYQRSKKAVKALRSFVIKHMKVQDVKIGKELNDKILERGRKNPPSKVEIKAIMFEDKDKVFVKVNLVDVAIEAPKEEEKKGVLDKVKDRVVGEKKEEVKEEKPKEEVKEEIEKKKEEEEKEKKKVLESAKLEKKVKPKAEKKDLTKRQQTKIKQERRVAATGKK